MTDYKARLEQRLAELDTAISAVENGAQSYSIGSITVTRATLSTMYRQRTETENELRRCSGGGVYIATFDGR